MATTGRPRGRPPKDPAVKYEKHMITVPPALWQVLRERVPPREQSRFIQEAVAEKLGVPLPTAGEGNEE